MIPFETIPLNVSGATHPVSSPFVIEFFRFFGLNATIIDGSILPLTYLLFMFVVWGIWHLILMGVESYGALPRVYSKLKELFDADNH